MSISKSLFGTTKDGRDVFAYLIENNNHMKINLITLGATLQSILVKNKDGEEIDILLGFDDVEGFQERHDYQGMIVGPVANRISAGGITIDGEKVAVTKTHGDVTLHSNGDFSNAVWDAIIVDSDAVEFSYLSPDGKEGFPGNKKVTVKYTLTDKNEIVIEYNAVSDKKTAFNITNHAYFNLKGYQNGDILDHTLYINADSFTPMSEEFLCTGEIRAVDGTPYDFREPKTIGRDIDEDYDQLKIGDGYDHNFCINDYDGNVRLAATATAPSGVRLDCYTDLPGTQLYVGNGLCGKVGKGGIPMEKRTGFCLETQYFPNATNIPQFENCVFDKDEPMKSTTIFKVTF